MTTDVLRAQALRPYKHLPQARPTFLLQKRVQRQVGQRGHLQIRLKGQPALVVPGDEPGDVMRVRGFIDRVDRSPDGRVRIIDYKTAGPWAYTKKAVTEARELMLSSRNLLKPASGGNSKFPSIEIPDSTTLTRSIVIFLFRVRSVSCCQSCILISSHPF